MRKYVNTVSKLSFKLRLKLIDIYDAKDVSIIDQCIIIVLLMMQPNN